MLITLLQRLQSGEILLEKNGLTIIGSDNSDSRAYLTFIDYHYF